MSWAVIPEDKLAETITLTQPSKPIMVTTLNDDGSIHVAPFGWFMPVSWKPPIIGLALLDHPKKQHTLINIENRQEFVVNLPSMDIAEKMIRSSYRIWPEGRNKFEALGLTAKPSVKIQTPGFAEARAQIECKVREITMPGDHKLIVADVVGATYNSELYNQHLLLRLDKAMPMIHLEQWGRKDGQVHMFLTTLGVQIYEVPFDVEQPEMQELSGPLGEDLDL